MPRSPSAIGPASHPKLVYHLVQLLFKVTVYLLVFLGAQLQCTFAQTAGCQYVASGKKRAHMTCPGRLFSPQASVQASTRVKEPAQQHAICGPRAVYENGGPPPSECAITILSFQPISAEIQWLQPPAWHLGCVTAGAQLNQSSPPLTMPKLVLP